MNTASLLRELDDMFPFASAGKWDRVGLQIGGFDREVGLVGVCHEVTENVVAEAMSLGATAIVTYHPLLFASTSSLIAGPTPEGRALRLAAADIDVISIHTALDVATPGTADALLDRLGLRASTTFGPVDDDGGADIGRIVHLDNTTNLRVFAAAIAEVTGSPTRFAGDEDADISVVGVIPGSGGSFVAGAVGMMDLFVSGDIGHHDAAMASASGLCIIDAGHAPTERPGVEALYDAVCSVRPNTIRLTDDPHPWEG
ncbi:MAG: Nif3-like dinuclear metal center hexameric protein [Actinomycetota bacterium]|nr:Nif3-like dinuclear metal center hexameric protein [Actinomycetota bacterium]